MDLRYANIHVIRARARAVAGHRFVFTIAARADALFAVARRFAHMAASCTAVRNVEIYFGEVPISSADDTVCS